MNTEVQSSISTNELATLLIPMQGCQWVLPNVTVAEIIPYMPPEFEEGKPEWYLGAISWRNTQVPVLSFERLNGVLPEQDSSNRRIAVLNGVVDSERQPFCAVVIQGVPRLMRIMPNEVASQEGAELGLAEQARVLVSGEEAIIPNVDYIQGEALALTA